MEDGERETPGRSGGADEATRRSGSSVRIDMLNERLVARARARRRELLEELVR